MAKLEINLPAVVSIALGKDSGRRMEVDMLRLPANIVEAIVVAGIKVIGTNVYNGGGKDAKPEEREAALQKKLDAWYRGEFNIVSRGDSMMTALREAYVDDVKAKTGATASEVEKSIKALVHSTFGEKEAATFGRFVDAVAIAIAREQHGGKASDEQIAAARDAFEARYQGLADEAAKRRAAATSKVDLTGLALGDFLKAK